MPNVNRFFTFEFVPLHIYKHIFSDEIAQAIIPPNHQKSLGRVHSKIKWRAIYMQIYQEMSDYPILEAEIASARKRFSQPLPTSKPATMTQSAQTTILPYQP